LPDLMVSRPIDEDGICPNCRHNVVGVERFVLRTQRKTAPLSPAIEIWRRANQSSRPVLVFRAGLS